MKHEVSLITSNQTEVIQVRGLHKHYGRLAAVRGIDFTVHKGEMFGLIGPDGAGKTTTFHILAGLIEATAGEVQIFNQRARSARSSVGYLTQQFSLYLDLSIDENLHYTARLRQVPNELLQERRNKYLKLMNLEQFGDRLDVLVKDVAAGKTQVRSQLLLHQLAYSSIETTEPTLENVFVTAVRLQTSAPQFSPFPYYRVGRRKGEKEEMSSTPQSSHSLRLYPDFPHSSSNIAIYAHNLNRVFGNFQAVKNVNISVRYGEIFGLLGANGSGKTTTIKMLCGLLKASSGEISLGGETHNLRSANLRRRIGYMSQKFTLYDDLSILENLEFYSGVYGLPRKLRREKIDWVIAICGLEGQEHMLTGNLPGGWKQRVAFGASVSTAVQVLIDATDVNNARVIKNNIQNVTNFFMR